MSRYSFGKPWPARPFTSAGEWKDEPCVLSLQTRIKVVVRPPVGFGGPGNDIDADELDPQLRQLIADVLIGSSTLGFTIVGVTVEQFEDAGG